MKEYRATVTRDGKSWLITVDGVGMTQARHIGEVEYMARDFLATWFDVPQDSFALSIDFGELVGLVKSARSAAKAAEATKEAIETEAVKSLKAQGVPIRDVAALLDISPAWVKVLARRAA